MRAFISEAKVSIVGPLGRRRGTECTATGFRPSTGPPPVVVPPVFLVLSRLRRIEPDSRESRIPYLVSSITNTAAAAISATPHDLQDDRYTTSQTSWPTPKPKHIACQRPSGRSACKLESTILLVTRFDNHPVAPRCYVNAIITCAPPSSLERHMCAGFLWFVYCRGST